MLLTLILPKGRQPNQFFFSIELVVSMCNQMVTSEIRE